MNRVKNIVRAWLPLAVITTAFCGLAYVTVQQSLRQGANDPQIQMAEDAAAALDRGESAGTVVPRGGQDIARSLAPFLILYDAQGKPQQASALLGGQLPDYPIGALQAAGNSGENRVTWQPQADVRIASVAVPYQGGYVVAGRSLREVETREAQIQTIAFLTWILTLIAVLAVVAFGEIAIGTR